MVLHEDLEECEGSVEAELNKHKEYVEHLETTVSKYIKDAVEKGVGLDD